MSAHTPGDWTWFVYPNGKLLLTGRDRAVIHCPDAPMSVSEPDRALIAAAPDMYEALRDAVASLGGIRSILVPDSVRAAIVKAEGRS